MINKSNQIFLNMNCKNLILKARNINVERTYKVRYKRSYQFLEIKELCTQILLGLLYHRSKASNAHTANSKPIEDFAVFCYILDSLEIIFFEFNENINNDCLSPNAWWTNRRDNYELALILPTATKFVLNISTRVSLFHRRFSINDISETRTALSKQSVG